MKLYVNFAFLENLVLAEEQTERHFYIKKLLSSPQAGVELIIDVDAETAYADPDKRAVFRQIAQRLPTTDVTFLSACQTSQFHESGETRLLFVDDVALAIIEDFGCFVVSTICLERSDFLFYAEDIRVDSSLRDWSMLNGIKHPCNAIVLTDNYLFSDKDSYLENITSICENLMPDTLTENFSFDFTLIGYDAKNEFRPVKDQYNILSDYFRTKFSYPVNLTIIRSTYHDRFIFTNYYCITSGNGFALFKNRQLIAGKQTTLHCKALTLEGRLSSMRETRNDELQKCVAINRTDRMPDKIAGNRINRLLAQ